MSLKKHAAQILGLYVGLLVLSQLALAFLPGQAGLWLIIGLGLVAAIWVWRYDRQLVVANAIEAPGVASTQSRVIWGVTGIAIVLVIQLLGTWLENLLFHTAAPTLTQATTTLHTLPLYALVLIVIWPLLEELAFRRVIFGNLAGVIGTFGAALLSGLLFALATDPAHWLTATLVGIAYAYLYHQTGSVETPLIAHIGMLALTLGYAFGH